MNRPDSLSLHRRQHEYITYQRILHRCHAEQLHTEAEVYRHEEGRYQERFRQDNQSLREYGTGT